jgi:hypothetical protein
VLRSFCACAADDPPIHSARHIGDPDRSARARRVPSGPRSHSQLQRPRQLKATGKGAALRRSQRQARAPSAREERPCCKGPGRPVPRYGPPTAAHSHQRPLLLSQFRQLLLHGMDFRLRARVRGQGPSHSRQLMRKSAAPRHACAPATARARCGPRDGPLPRSACATAPFRRACVWEGRRWLPATPRAERSARWPSWLLGYGVNLRASEVCAADPGGGQSKSGDV